MPICQHCTSAIEQLYHEDRKNPHKKRVVILFPVLTQCQTSDCWICLKFSNWLEIEEIGAFDGWKTNPLLVGFFYIAQMGIMKTKFPSRLILGMQLATSDPDDEECCTIDLALVPPQDLNSQIKEAPTNPRRDSSDLSLVKDWVNTCRKTHKQCSGNNENWYPTRLLHIPSDSQQIRLIISKNHAPNGQYMTLSHRWRKIENTQLRTSTMEQFQRAIPILDLPPSFQDAIKIATFLEIQYLWIDALCIMQDEDRVDWKTESLTMGKVYENAFLNISASLASDGSESLFQNKEWSQLRPSEIKLKFNGRAKRFYLLDGDVWTDEIDNAPLNTRGWVFQERFLCQRIVHFSLRQLGWECRGLTALEMLPKGLPANIGTPLSKSSFHSRLIKVKRHTRRSSVQDWLNDWRDIVEAYSMCHLTFPGDKSIAFAGIGASISKSLTTEIFSGMLAKSLICDLAWWRWTEDKENFPMCDTSHRAPSWSWMSVDGAVNFPSNLSGVKNARKFVENLEIVSVTGDPLGQHNILRLWSICMPLRVTWSDGLITSFSFPDISACKFSISDTEQEVSIDFEITPEEMENLTSRGRVLLLPLFGTPSFLNGILITSNRGRNSYRRIGAVHLPIQMLWGHNDENDSKTEGVSSEKPRRGARVTRVADKDFLTIWNDASLRLVRYILRSSFRVIEIS